MWVISVLPCGKTASHRELFYFSTHTQSEGSIVEMSARGKKKFGVVMACTALKDSKQEIRSANFQLQKITAGGKRVLSQEFLRAAFRIADYHACSLGAVIDDLVPQTVLDSYSKLPEQLFYKEKYDSQRESVSISSVIAPRSERIKIYAEIVKKTIDQKKSILIVAPTVVEATRLHAALSKQAKAILLHSDLSKKMVQEAWGAIAQEKKAFVVIGTPLVLSAPLHTIGSIILERTLARGYARDRRPYLQIRSCVEALAREHGASLILGAATPLIEEDVSLYSPPREASINITVVDMRIPADVERVSKKSFQLFSPEAIERISASSLTGENLLLLCARRGFATQTVCEDCGTTLTCSICGSSLLLRAEKNARLFECSYCEHTEPATIHCPICNSWRLTPLGIGLERVEEEVRRLFPKREVFTAEENILSDATRAEKFTEHVTTCNGAILIGTESILPYLEEIPTAIVVSIDSFFFMPEYTAPARTHEMLFELNGIAQKELLIQTRLPEHRALRALQESTEKFLKDERELRKKFSYPPLTILLRLSITASIARLPKEREALLALLKEYKAHVIRGRSKRLRYIREHIVLRIPIEKWPDRTLLARLRQLSPSVEIRVNPLSVFGD